MSGPYSFLPAVLDALDRLLGYQGYDAQTKVSLLREVENAAKRMADNIERQQAGALS